MKISSKKVIDAAAISATGTVVSSAIPVEYMLGFSIVLSTVSTATGAAKLQASMDGVIWIDLPNSGATANISVAGAGDRLWNVTDVFYPQVRVSYTNTANSGTLDVTFFAKGW